MTRRIRSVPGLRGLARISLLTITTEEFPIVQEIFGLTQNVPATPYFVANVNAEMHPLVLRRSSAQTNIISAESAGDFVQDYRPEFIFLIGTAGGYGGRDGLALGDVVVSNYVEFSGYWKYKENQILRRKLPHDHPSLYLYENFVEPLRVTPESWRPYISRPRPQPGQSTMLIGEIVSGDVLLGNPNNAEQRRILEFFDKALGFEMEAVGLARAIYKARSSVEYNPQFMVIRGISDLVNTDRAGNQATRIAWTDYAVSAAAAVSKALSDNLLQALEALDDEDGLSDEENGFFRRLYKRSSRWLKQNS